LTDDAAAFRSTKDCVDLTDDAAASRSTKVCFDLTDDLAMDCEYDDYVNDDDLSEAMVTSSVLGVYQDKEAVLYYWAAREAVITLQGASYTYYLAHDNYNGQTTSEVCNLQSAIALSPPKGQYSRSAVIEHHAAVMSVVAQVHAQVVCSSREDEVIRIRGG
jgi:hypothetical protein